MAEETIMVGGKPVRLRAATRGANLAREQEIQDRGKDYLERPIEWRAWFEWLTIQACGPEARAVVPDVEAYLALTDAEGAALLEAAGRLNPHWFQAVDDEDALRKKATSSIGNSGSG